MILENFVSIIMPAFNSAKYIAESIESVLAQTYQKWELLIIDDGSTDKTASIVKAYELKDTRIKYIYQENGRQGKARNNGLKHANGNLIAFLDSDDLWMPEKLAKQVTLIETANYDLVFSRGYIFYNTDIYSEDQFFKSFAGKYIGKSGLIEFIKGNKIPILSVLVKKSALLAVNGFEENPGIQNTEDYHLWLKLLNNGFTILGTDEFLVRYRMHTASATSNKLNLYPKEIEMLKLFKFNDSEIEAARQKSLRLLYKKLFSEAANQNAKQELQTHFFDLGRTITIHKSILIWLHIAFKLNTRLFLSSIWRLL